MKDIGLKIGTIIKLQKALKAHRSTKDTAKGTNSQTKPEDTPPKRRTKSSDYNPATPTENWKCQSHYKEHDVFISYRVDSDKHNATALHGTLAVAPYGQMALHPYLDNQCLCDAADWEQGFINGLYQSNLIVLILSEAGLKKTFTAHDVLDNQFLEIQHALKRMKDGEKSGNPVTIQPILMWSPVEKKGGGMAAEKYFPPVKEFPDHPPMHEKSPLFDGKPMTIRETFAVLMKLQALDAVDENALKRLVPKIRELITKTSTAAKEGDVYTQGGSVVLTAEQDSLLRSLLDPVDSTQDQHDLEDLYVEGTRQWLFDQVTHWVNEDTADTVLWVNAVAGVGKSVAAAKLASFLRSKSQLVSALFLKYNDTRKSDPRAVLSTIAYGLCQWYAPIGRKLLDAGHSKDSLDKMSIPELFKAVIADPLEAIGKYRPKGSVMILVDALDECSPRDQLLSLLAWRFVELNKTRPWLKLLLTSRPEDDIKAAFHGVNAKTIEPSSDENIADLRVFIRHRLTNEHKGLTEVDRDQAIEIILHNPAQSNEHGKPADTKDSADDDKSKTFVWINLILNTLKEQAKSEAITLDKIREINDSATDVKQLYGITFTKIHSVSSRKDELITVISAIATSQTILTPNMIAGIFFRNVAEGYALRIVHECLRSLNLVLAPGANGSTDDGEVKFNHKSVADYLLGDESKNEPWHVSSSFHTVFAKGCLDVILSHEPVINICEIFDFHDKIPDLEDRVNKTITPSLRYSVAHWVTHLTEGTKVNGVELDHPFETQSFEELAPSLTQFMSSHVFHWLECGSLTHVVKPIIEQLAVLRGVIAKAPSTIVDDTTKELVKDTYRFIREFADPIIASAPQVYNSGYAFTPKETAIYKTYATQLEDKIPFLVTAGPAPTWHPCEMTLTGHSSQVNSVAISPDGKWIVSGSWDKTIKVWDATTGQLKHTLEGHTWGVTSVAISPDGKWIVSGSGSIIGSGDNNTIKVWDATTGQVKHTLEGHTRDVTSVAISSDGNSILSRDRFNNQILWVRRGDEWVQSDEDPSNFTTASDPHASSLWTEIDEDNAPQWIRHGSHITKVPHSLFGDWDKHDFTPSGGVAILTRETPHRPVIILPIYLNTREIRAEVARYIEARPAITAAFEEARTAVDE